MKKIMIDDTRIKAVEKHIKALIDIGQRLNDHHIDWHIGGSLMLYLRGIDVSVEDIDIIIESSEFKDMTPILSPYKPRRVVDNSIYRTEAFFELTVGGVDVDLMIGFKVQTPKGLYTYNVNCMLDYIDIDQFQIPLASLEEWYRAYSHMDRKAKVALLKPYIHQQE